MSATTWNDEETFDAAEPSTAVKPLNIWAPSEFLAWTEPEGSHYLLPKYVSRERLTAIIGPPGVGKSRLILWLAIDQILRREWCGLLTGGDPQKWLLLGDENSIARTKGDLECIWRTLDERERTAIETNLRLQAILDAEDGDLDLQDDVVGMRVQATIRDFAPGVVSFDPLASFYAGDLSKPGEMKLAVRLVEQTVRRSAPKAATIVSNHARQGRLNLVQAVGFDSGNYSLGGKALIARCRAALNIAPLDENGSGNCLIACAKSNDCQAFTPRGVRLDPETMSYALDPDFNLESWRACVEGKRTAGSALVDLKEVVRAVRDGYATTSQITEALTAAYCCSKSTVEKLLKKALDGDFLKQITRGRYTLGPRHNRLFDNEK